jgi:hypothetical protein
MTTFRPGSRVSIIAELMCAVRFRRIDMSKGRASVFL